MNDIDPLVPDWDPELRLMSFAKALPANLTLGQFLELEQVRHLVYYLQPWKDHRDAIMQEARELVQIYNDLPEVELLRREFENYDAFLNGRQQTNKVAKVEFVPQPSVEEVNTIGLMIEPVVEAARLLIRGGRVVTGPQIPVPLRAYGQLKQVVDELEAFIAAYAPESQ